MSGKRFESIKSAIHFSSDEDRVGKPKPGTKLYDRTAKVRIVLDTVVEKSHLYYKLPNAVSLDEMMTASR